MPYDHHHDSEPVHGLPEAPPPGERILWQGAPDWWMLTRRALSLDWVAGYFLLLAAWRGTAIGLERGAVLGLKATVPYLVLGAVACAILALIALVLARTTVYTITNRRVALRIGAALTVTLNVPFTRLDAANLSLEKNGTGTIALRTNGKTRISYLVCWPHVRPWRIAPTEPALRLIPDAARVAALLSEAAETRVAETSVYRVEPAAAIAAE
jgi:hypothetical protein